MTMQVQVVSPERILWSGDAEMVTARTVEGGDISFLTGHAPFVGALEIGRVTVRPTEGADVFFAVHGGFVEVSHNQVNILSDVAELADQIDRERAIAAKERAETTLAHEASAEAQAALARACARLNATGGISTSTR